MKLSIIIILFNLVSFTLLSQEYSTLKTVSSSVNKMYQKGIKLYKSNEYDKARKTFEKILKKEPKFIDANILLASIEFEVGQFEAAEKYFNKALSLNSEYQSKVFYTLAICNYSNQHYSDAFQNMSIFLNKEKENQDLIKKAKTKLITYRFSDSATRNPVPFNPISIPNVNSDFSEYLPSLTADGKTMVFTRKIFNENEDLFICYKSDDGFWSVPESLSEINTPLNEGAPSISQDGNTLIFVSCDRMEGFGGCDLYISNKKNNKWSIPVNLGEKINTPAYETQPCISENGNLIFFCSNRVGGYGGRDLWMSSKNSNNSWRKPVNLGPTINTPNNEECPFLHQDGVTLFFSSDGHPGMGNKDIFYSKYIGTNSWSSPINFGYPVNSPLDESSFVAYFDGTKALITSDKLFLKERDPNKLKYKNLDLYEFVLPEDRRPIASCYLKFEVLDVVANKPLAATIEIFRLHDQKIFFTETLSNNGVKLISLPGGEEFAINITHPEYQMISDQFNCLSNTVFYPELKIWKMNPLHTISKPTILKNIFFETGSALLKSESYFELDKLVQILQKQKEYKILISGHTDNIGNVQDNLTLSESRAKSVTAYLISKGVNAERLSAKGIGESEPIDSNSTEEGRQKNRRTEFLLFK